MNLGKNEILGHKNIDGKLAFYVSYCDTSDNGEETALVFTKDRESKFLIINGRHEFDSDVLSMVAERKKGDNGYTTNSIEDVEEIIGESIESFVSKFDE